MERAALQVQYRSNKTTMEKEAIELAAAAAPKSIIPADYVFNASDIAASAAKLTISATDATDLQKKLVAKNLEIQKKLVVVAEHKTTVDTTYDHYVDHINAFNAANKRNNISPSANVTAAGKGYIPPEDDKDSVGVDTNLSVDCSNPECSTPYSASVYGLGNIVTLSEGGSSGGYKGHKETCNEKPHKGHQYWSCPTGSVACDKSYEHYVVCNGACGKEAPPTYEWMILIAHSPGKGEIVPPELGEQTGGQVKVRTTIASHRRYCEDPTTRLTWNGKCNTWYYNCHVNYDSGMRTSCPMTGTHRTHDDGHWYNESGSISASSGSSSVSAGDSYTVGLTTTTAFSSVYWYVAGPGDSGLGSHVETDTGGSSSTTESFTYPSAER